LPAGTGIGSKPELNFEWRGVKIPISGHIPFLEKTRTPQPILDTPKAKTVELLKHVAETLLSVGELVRSVGGPAAPKCDQLPCGLSIAHDQIQLSADALWVFLITASEEVFVGIDVVFIEVREPFEALYALDGRQEVID
jgi:hypothetical protein